VRKGKKELEKRRTTEEDDTLRFQNDTLSERGTNQEVSKKKTGNRKSVSSGEGKKRNQKRTSIRFLRLSHQNTHKKESDASSSSHRCTGVNLLKKVVTVFTEARQNVTPQSIALLQLFVFGVS